MIDKDIICKILYSVELIFLKIILFYKLLISKSRIKHESYYYNKLKLCNKI